MLPQAGLGLALMPVSTTGLRLGSLNYPQHALSCPKLLESQGSIANIPSYKENRVGIRNRTVYSILSLVRSRMLDTKMIRLCGILCLYTSAAGECSTSAKINDCGASQADGDSRA